jgi:predicted HD phosphohydrolase
MHDRFRSRFRLTAATNRLRRQIALEAARRLLPTLAPKDDDRAADWLEGASSNDLYTAKRKAAAVLGHRVRPGDLPSDAEVREQLLALFRAGERQQSDVDVVPDRAEDEAALCLADHLDRFAIYKMRLLPLETIKQNPKLHPEGDVLYHSLQVFELARDARSYDEEFLLAALLHDVGKAIDQEDHVAAGVQALRGTVTERTLWLIEHHMDLLSSRDRPIPARLKRELEASEYFEDLKLLRELDDAGRVPGMQVSTIDEVLAYLFSLDQEAYLEE